MRGCRKLQQRLPAKTALVPGPGQSPDGERKSRYKMIVSPLPSSCPAHSARSARIAASGGVSRRAHIQTASETLRPRASKAEPETEEKAYQRRVNESRTVEERVTSVYSEADLKAELQKAGQRLVVLEVESSEQCDTGLAEEAELHWKEDKQAALAPCSGLKHLLQRTARDCPDVKFLTLEADTQEGQEACDKLGVDVLPTLQFYKGGQKLWEHRGHLHLQQDLGEGVLYYGGSAAGGLKAGEFVTELTSREDLQQFTTSQDERILTVVDVSLSNAVGCVRLFPAVLALAKSFKGFASFARLLGDANPETQQMMSELDIKAVPTMLFYRGGKEVGRHVGSSRGDLMGQILQVQAAYGVRPPPPPKVQGRPRRSVAPV